MWKSTTKKELTEENEQLKKRIKVAQEWMKKEFKNSTGGSA